jgi:hypothetical protein
MRPNDAADTNQSGFTLLLNCDVRIHKKSFQTNADLRMYVINEASVVYSPNFSFWECHLKVEKTNEDLHKNRLKLFLQILYT